MKYKSLFLGVFLLFLCFFAAHVGAIAQQASVSVIAPARLVSQEQVTLLKSALSDVQDVRRRISSDELDDLVKRIESAIAQIDRAGPVGIGDASGMKTAAEHDSDKLISLILVLAPVFCGIIFVMAFAQERRRRTNPAYQAALRDLRLAAIDFGVSDEELLAFRRAIASMPRDIE